MSIAPSASPVEAVRAHLALGANLGDRAATLGAALAALDATDGVRVVLASRFHETAAVGGPTGQPDFLNAACVIETTLSPTVLLDRVAAIEAAHGRALDRARSPRWGPRGLDIDIILYGDRVIDVPDLRVPHPRAAERAFVLEPLAEIDPDARFPDRGGATARDLLAVLRANVGTRCESRRKRAHPT